MRKIKKWLYYEPLFFHDYPEIPSFVTLLFRDKDWVVQILTSKVDIMLDSAVDRYEVSLAVNEKTHAVICRIHPEDECTTP